MRWIRANDRLPKLTGWICIKNFSPDGFIWFNGKDFIYHNEPLILHENVLWLFEDEPPEASKPKDLELLKTIVSSIMVGIERHDLNSIAIMQELKKLKNTIERMDEPPEEGRFENPTDEQLINMAIVWNNGKLQHRKLADMMGMCRLVVDRLYENGKINVPCSKEENGNPFIHPKTIEP